MIYEHISNNNKHLIPEEKYNLGNLGTSILNYYNAVNDGDDYTNAFQSALRDEAVRRVYVPGGIYRITGELTVRDNCELELAQDAVLEFDPNYTWEETDEETGETTIHTINPSDFRCITLKMLSSLVGNHATIRVHTGFEGSVIYVSTKSHPTDESLRSFEPFSRWDPQWKPARYLKDVNIVQENDDGFCYSSEGEHSGTAVYINGHRGEEGSNFIWGLDFEGLRISGAFDYGIKCENTKIESKSKNGWTYDSRINGFIFGCKTSVYLDNCSNVRISTTIQPSASVDETVYADYGIYIKESQNVDLTGSRVWDWNADETMWTAGGENQHLRLVGDCKGLILDDFIYYSEESYDLRDLIKVDEDEQLDHITILQEPVSKFFSFEKEGDNEPEFFNTTYLKDGIYVKPEFIEDLDDRIRTIIAEINGGN